MTEEFYTTKGKNGRKTKIDYMLTQDQITTGQIPNSKAPCPASRTCDRIIYFPKALSSFTIPPPKPLTHTASLLN